VIDLLKLWNIGDDEVANPSYILAHGYGTTKNKELPISAKRVLEKTVELMKKFPSAKCIIFDSNYFAVPQKYTGKSEEYECELKKKYLASLGADFSRIIFGTDFKQVPLTICSTVQEVGLAMSHFYLGGDEVISVCDRIHARRVRYILRKSLHNWLWLVKYKIIGVDGVWTKNMPSKWQQSDFRWLLCNVVGCLGYALLGIDRLSKTTHKVK
jgi:hypothetical protein